MHKPFNLKRKGMVVNVISQHQSEHDKNECCILLRCGEEYLFTESLRLSQSRPAKAMTKIQEKRVGKMIQSLNMAVGVKYI